MTVHDTSIDGTTATCPCGWAHTTANLGALQAAAIDHELSDDTPPPPTEAGGGASTGGEAADDIVAGQLARVARKITRHREQAEALTEQRDRLIVELRRSGWSYGRIGELADLAKQRVDQIVNRE